MHHKESIRVSNAEMSKVIPLPIRIYRVRSNLIAASIEHPRSVPVKPDEFMADYTMVGDKIEACSRWMQAEIVQDERYQQNRKIRCNLTLISCVT